MKLNRINRLFIITAVLVFLITCNNDDSNGESAPDIAALRAQQIVNQYDNEIVIRNTTFIQAVNDYKQLVDSFTISPSENSLQLLKDHWELVAKAWASVELYNLGEIESSFISFAIFQAPIDTESIESILLDTVTLDLDYFIGLGSNKKGITALEYLLFDKDLSLTFSSLINDSRRMSYLKGVTNELLLDVETFESAWSSYSDTFKGATQSGLDGGQNLLINSMVTVLENIIRHKLGRALGNENGGSIAIEGFDTYRSDVSRDLVMNNIEALQETYMGNFNNIQGYGFEDYLIFLGNPTLNQTIVEAFQEVQQDMSLISSFNETLENNPHQIQSLFDHSEALLVLIKTDLASYIGATITFNNTDGD